MNRIGFLGASDVAVILGLSKFKTPHQLWLEKTGQADPSPSNLYTEVGHALEDTVLRLAAKRLEGGLLGKPEYRLPDAPWFKAALDGECLLPTGEIVALEAKTCSFAKRDGGWGREGSELVPAAYWAQTQMQVLAARANGRPISRAVVGCLFLNRLGDGLEKQPQLFNVPFDEKAAHGMLERARDFWECIENREWPREAA